MAKKDTFNEILNDLHSAGVTKHDEFIAHEIELLARKRTSKKPTKTQIANEALKERIGEAMALVGEPMTIGEIVKELGDEGLTPQKMSRMLKDMGANKTMVKGKAYFSL